MNTYLYELHAQGQLNHIIGGHANLRCLDENNYQWNPPAPCAGWPKTNILTKTSVKWLGSFCGQIIYVAST